MNSSFIPNVSGNNSPSIFPWQRWTGENVCGLSPMDHECNFAPAQQYIFPGHRFPIAPVVRFKEPSVVKLILVFESIRKDFCESNAFSVPNSLYRL